MPIIHWAETTTAYQKFQGRQGRVEWDVCMKYWMSIWFSRFLDLKTKCHTLHKPLDTPTWRFFKVTELWHVQLPSQLVWTVPVFLGEGEGASWNRNCKKRRPGILSSFSLWIKAVSIIPSPRAPRNTGTPSRRLLEWNLHVFPMVWDWKQFCIQWLILSLKNWSFTGQHSGQKSYKLGSFDLYWSLLCWEPHNLCT